MKIGVCRGLDDFEAMKIACVNGVDYWECGFGSLVNYDDEKIKMCKDALKRYNISCTVANGFIPSDMKVVGDDVDYIALEKYLKKGFERAKSLGIKTVVFGSGKARSFPDGFSPEKAKEQLAFFLKEYASPLAAQAGIVIAMEPLRFCESSMIHTVSDGLEIAERSGCDNVFALADLYHVYGNDDCFDDVSKFGGKLKHAHIAEPVKRIYPSSDDSEDVVSTYKSFIETIKNMGCNTLSIEAHTENFSYDFPRAVEILKSITG